MGSAVCAVLHAFQLIQNHVCRLESDDWHRLCGELPMKMKFGIEGFIADEGGIQAEDVLPGVVPHE
jgi:hypothetical protein